MFHNLCQNKKTVHNKVTIETKDKIAKLKRNHLTSTKNVKIIKNIKFHNVANNAHSEIIVALYFLLEFWII